MALKQELLTFHLWWQRATTLPQDTRTAHSSVSFLWAMFYLLWDSHPGLCLSLVYLPQILPQLLRDRSTHTIILTPKILLHLCLLLHSKTTSNSKARHHHPSPGLCLLPPNCLLCLQADSRQSIFYTDIQRYSSRTKI